MEDYKKILSKYNELVEINNTNVSTWTTEEALKSRNKIDAVSNQLHQMLRTFESLRNQINEKTDLLNKLIDQQNQLATDYNKRFSSGRRFDQGKFDNGTIYIYQFSNFAE